jgi:hypothetical protein
VGAKVFVGGMDGESVKLNEGVADSVEAVAAGLAEQETTIAAMQPSTAILVRIFIGTSHALARVYKRWSEGSNDHFYRGDINGRIGLFAGGQSSPVQAHPLTVLGAVLLCFQMEILDKTV